MLAVSREALITVAVVAAVLLWMGPSLYRQDLVFLAATYSLIALGMYVPFVLAGSLSMAYSAYAAIGAYAVALISRFGPGCRCGGDGFSAPSPLQRLQYSSAWQHRNSPASTLPR